MRRHHVPPAAFSLAILALMVLVIGPSQAVGQSGRRGSSSKPVAVPTPEPEPTPNKPKADKAADAIKVIVGIDRSGGFDFIPLQLYSVALYGCSDRLDESPSVSVEATQRDIGRGEAADLAKKEKETYVVWLKLSGASAGADRNVNNVSELSLEYLVFAPTTVKIVASGRTYQRSARVGGVVVGVPGSGRTDAVYVEYMVKQASRDAAERILSSLRPLNTGKPVPGNVR